MQVDSRWQRRTPYFRPSNKDPRGPQGLTIAVDYPET